MLRPRLIERLNEGLSLGRKLTLISAPAGFGKTMLISEWTASPWHRTPGQVYQRPVAWLSLDEGDNDPARFLTYLVASLQTITKEFGKGVLGAIQTSQPLATINEYLLITLLNDITAIPDPFILVLDDYHIIDSEPIDHALTFLLDHLPPQMHLVITSREDPSLPLPRYRVRGQLTELRAADLRFTPAEAAEFLNRMMGLNLKDTEISALEERTEGWIAGLQMAALSMQRRSDTAGFIQAFTGSHRFVLDYLAGEVLERQPERVRNFLLNTAILDRLSGSLCDSVTAQAGGREMLESLERANLFVVPLDDQRQWYRYHHLFADVLRAHLMEAQPGLVAALHRRASAWYVQNGYPSDAIRHALYANDFEHAAGLIELAWPAAEEGSIQPAAWLGWVKALPEELVRVRPILMVWYAYALLGRGELEAAESRLQDAEQWLETAKPLKGHPATPSIDTCPESSRRLVVVNQEQYKSLPAAIAVGRAFIAQALGNIPDTVRYASRVLELTEVDPIRHSQAAMLLGMSYWASGDLEAANRVFADYTMKLRTAGNIPDAIGTTVVLADIRLALGRLREAIITIEQLLQFVMDLGEPIYPDTADLHRGLSELFLAQGSPEAAAQHLQKSKEMGEKAELPVLRYRLCIAQARFKETQDDLDGALALLDEAARLYIRSPLPDTCPISAMKARIWVAQGRLIEAQEWVRVQGLSVDDDLDYMHEFGYITLARILIAQVQNDRMDSSIDAVMRFLDRLLQAAEEGGRMGSVIEILVLQAFARQAIATKERGGITPALLPLEQALTLAEPEGYVRIFVDEGQPMRLLIADIRLQIEKQKGDQYQKLIAYADRLLVAFSQRMVEPQSKTPALPGTARQGRCAAGASVRNRQSTMIEPLSERELEVLRLLRTELTGPEIARELMVSLNTVRTHTQNIYAKLGVNNRRAAVLRAVELDL